MMIGLGMIYDLYFDVVLYLVGVNGVICNGELLNVFYVSFFVIG